jgi:hypothetical protein
MLKKYLIRLKTKSQNWLTHCKDDRNGDKIPFFGEFCVVPRIRGDKKPLRKDCVNFEVKGLRKAVSLSEEPTDPAMDQGSSVTLHVLRRHTEGVVSQEWRRYWMDGSDSDDGDGNNKVYVCCWTKAKHRPVPAVTFI